MARKKHLRRYLPTLVGAAVVVGVSGLVVWAISGFIAGDNGAPKRAVQEITLLAPPPPPPPPPKIDEPPPEPEMEEEVEVPEPEAIEDLPELPGDDVPPGDALGLDAEGGAGDSFGLIGRKGGRGLLSGDPHMLYAAGLQRDIEDALAEIKAVRSKTYSAVVEIWVDEQGAVIRADLSRSTGSDEIDEMLVNAIRTLKPQGDAPPTDMPSPIRLRISSRA